MKKVTKLAIALLVLFQAARADIPLTLSEVYEDSMLWSAYLTLHESIAVEGGELKQGTRGVLIRLELTPSGVEALLDFGRQGIHKIPAERTDLLSRAEELQLGAVLKQLPNMTGLLYSRLIKVEGDDVRRYTPEDAANLEQFICVRMADSPECWDLLDAELTTLREHGAGDVVEVILFLDVEDMPLSDGEMLSRIQEYEITDVSYLYSFLSIDYMRILWTGLPEFECSIEMLRLDVNGKLLERVER